MGVDQENIPPEGNAQQTTPEQNTAAKDALLEIKLTVPETPSPDQPRVVVFGSGKKIDHGNDNQLRGKMRHMKKAVNTRNMDHHRLQNAGEVSAYSEVFSSATQYLVAYVRNYRRSPLRSNNSIELSMIVRVIASTIPGIVKFLSRELCLQP
ncbi:hypothetical protein MKX01_024544 [Papaver californicum]|nr:hypothetical protein MKX01_024544 [Papaver californicum]